MSGDSPTSEAATIPRDLACVRCGYNLRGTPEDHACPECGLPVGQSKLKSRWLWAGDPKWQRKIWWGSRLLMVGYLGRIVTWFGALVMVFGREPRGSVLFTGAWWISGGVVEGLGAWLLASREPVQAPWYRLRVIVGIVTLLNVCEGLLIIERDSRLGLVARLDAWSKQFGITGFQPVLLLLLAAVSIWQTMVLYRLGRSLVGRLHQSRVEGLGAFAQVCLVLNAGFMIGIITPSLFDERGEIATVFLGCGVFFLLATWLPGVLAGAIFWKVLAREIRRPSRRRDVEVVSEG